jgi:hypothetical protein
MKENAGLTADQIVVGKTYRAKRPTYNFYREPNDRTVVWMGESQVQYDGPSIPNGRRLPIVPMAAFLKWAGSVVEASE